MSELKKCPFCGEEEPLMRERYINGIANVRGYRRECRRCKATFANWYRSMKKADESWNRRSDGWIPVTEQEPPDSGVYLVCEKRLGVRVAYEDEWRAIDWKVTHWMPLPEPPAQEGE